MSRLLFAAARGARIQVRVFEFDKWINTPGIRFGNHDVYRIHPDDEHLQYGQISSRVALCGAARLVPRHTIWLDGQGSVQVRSRLCVSTRSWA